MSQLNLYATNREGVAIIERAILAHGAGRHLRILEAGCGNRRPVDLKGQSYELKGVDIDRNAVHIRQAFARLSDSFQCGDLRNRGLFPAQRGAERPVGLWVAVPLTISGA
jgi:hypothetical protein